ncbi:hypothetical protein CHS0354_025067 [Potamilus streckersoni]|uniref:Uncharacterized protein n=1 Tax=Potamilus streckersoni TaxID=2493646 RepID=A0AAE0W9G6_9BIVA|nr:hypothetical protein CHS0354_025067 [Potamilus streckersoni]
MRLGQHQAGIDVYRREFWFREYEINLNLLVEDDGTLEVMGGGGRRTLLTLTIGGQGLVKVRNIWLKKKITSDYRGVIDNAHAKIMEISNGLEGFRTSLEELSDEEEFSSYRLRLQERRFYLACIFNQPAHSKVTFRIYLSHFGRKYKITNMDTSLAQQLRTLFREQTFTISLIITILGFVIAQLYSQSQAVVVQYHLLLQFMHLNQTPPV